MFTGPAFHNNLLSITYSFLQIPPHDGHPCCSAIHFPLPGRVWDFHPLERAHGAHTKKGLRLLFFLAFVVPFIMSGQDRDLFLPYSFCQAENCFVRLRHNRINVPFFYSYFQRYSVGIIDISLTANEQLRRPLSFLFISSSLRTPFSIHRCAGTTPFYSSLFSVESLASNHLANPLFNYLHDTI